MLTRWRFGYPLREFDNLRLQVDRLFRDFDVTRGALGGLGAHVEWPQMNLVDTGAEFVIHAQVSGLSEDEIKIKATQDSVTVSGRRATKAPEGYAVHRRERATADFARSFALPAKVDLERVTANVNDGLLTIVLPRRAEDQPRSITVKAS
jgi:HSP20 family protein